MKVIMFMTFTFTLHPLTLNQKHYLIPLVSERSERILSIAKDLPSAFRIMIVVLFSKQRRRIVPVSAVGQQGYDNLALVFGPFRQFDGAVERGTGGNAD